MPVLAHPKYLNMSYGELDKTLDDLKKKGLIGLEVYYPDNTAEENELFKNLALKNQLVMTGGTDFHGENSPGIKLGRGTGDFMVSYDILEELKKTLSTMHNITAFSK